eukprot:TRINITY_DN1735_c0_g1_i5.p1 TRINITY_DN1735_c0_g1~~TRINITY_DN1735_c0_g1_i5.p1  ORF type:complete len:634 (+),score=-12.63 TRINITY_DN1735_c0_g1_i5:457-2358(+)
MKSSDILHPSIPMSPKQAPASRGHAAHTGITVKFPTTQTPHPEGNGRYSHVELMGQISDLERQILEMSQDFSLVSVPVRTTPIRGEPSRQKLNLSTGLPQRRKAGQGPRPFPDPSESTNRTTGTQTRAEAEDSLRGTVHGLEIKVALLQRELERERTQHVETNNRFMKLVREHSSLKFRCDEMEQSFKDALHSKEKSSSALSTELKSSRDLILRLETQRELYLEQVELISKELDLQGTSTHQCDDPTPYSLANDANTTTDAKEPTQWAITNNSYQTQRPPLVLDGVLETFICPRLFESRFVERLISPCALDGIEIVGPVIGCLFIRCLWSFEGGEEHAVSRNTLLHCISGSVQRLVTSTRSRRDLIFWLSNTSMLEHFLIGHGGSDKTITCTSSTRIQDTVNKLFFMVFSRVKQEISEELEGAFLQAPKLSSAEKQRTLSQALWTSLVGGYAPMLDNIFNTLTECAGDFRDSGTTPLFTDIFFREMFRWMFGYLFNTFLQAKINLTWAVGVKLRHNIGRFQRWTTKVHLGDLLASTPHFQAFHSMAELLLQNQGASSDYRHFPALTRKQHEYIQGALQQKEILPKISEVTVDLHTSTLLPKRREPRCCDYDLLFTKTAIPPELLQVVPFLVRK